MQLIGTLEITYIFILVGGSILAMNFVLIFGIKDFRPKKHPPKKPSDDESIVQEKKQMMKIAMGQIIDQVRTSKEFICAILGNFVFRMASISMYQYGPMLISSLFPDEEQKAATSLTSYLLLASNVIVIPLALSVGFLGDKVKAYKLLILFTTLATAFTALMVWEQEKGWKLYVGYVGGTSFIVTILLLVNIVSSNSQYRV